MPCWLMRPGFAKPNSARSTSGMGTPFDRWLRTMYRRRLPNPAGAVRSVPSRAASFHEVLRNKRTGYHADIRATRAYAERDPSAVAAVELGGVRALLAVPMLKDDELIGLISIYRQEV